VRPRRRGLHGRGGADHPRSGQGWRLAKDGGVWEQVGETVLAPTPTPPTSKRDACELHVDLSRLGFANKSHYEVASAKVGREISSLTELTADEVQAVWAHACLLQGYSIPCTRYYGRAVAA